jgi:hypothetical protein
VAFLDHEAGRGQRRQVMRQGRGGNVEQALDVAHVQPRLAGAHQQPEQPQPRPIGEPGECICSLILGHEGNITTFPVLSNQFLRGFP